MGELTESGAKQPAGWMEDSMSKDSALRKAEEQSGEDDGCWGSSFKYRSIS